MVHLYLDRQALSHRGGFRQALSSPAMSCLLPGQLSWLPWQGQGGQDGTVPELP